MTLAVLKQKIVALFDEEILGVPPMAPQAAPVAPAIAPPSWPLQKDMPTFYGDPGGYEASPQRSAWENANLVDVDCPWPLLMDKTPVTQIRIHRKCADSLLRVLGDIWDAVGHDLSAIQTLRYHLFSGSYAPRTIRGGTMPSCHNFAAAIDWDDQDNQQHATHHLFQDNSLLVVKFKAEGWIWGGDWSPQSVDAMHVQAALVHS